MTFSSFAIASESAASVLSTALVVAFVLHALEAVELPVARRLVDLQDLRRRVFLDSEFVNADDDLLAAFDPLLVLVVRFVNLPLEVPRSIPLRTPSRTDPSPISNLLKVLHDLGLQFVGERLDGEGAAHGVDDVGRARLLGDDLLGAKRDADSLLAQESQRLVETVGV